MDVMRIEGGNTLSGSISVSGAKNAALPIFAATLLTEETCILENVPNLSDIRFMAQILEHLGAEVEQIAPTSWKISAKTISHRAPYDLVRKMRASVCLMGPLAGRLKKAEISLPGGCVIGPRPIARRDRPDYPGTHHRDGAGLFAGRRSCFDRDDG